MIFPEDFELKLGFDQVRTKVKNYCLSPLGEKLTDHISFETDFGKISTLLKRTWEMKQVIEKGEPVPFSNYFDPSEFFKISSIEGSFIEEDGFRMILLSLQSILDCKRFFVLNKEAYPEMFCVTELVSVAPSLIAQIAGKFDDLGKVRDSATVELFRIRKRLREEQGRIRRVADHIFRQSVSQGWVPEGATMSVRDGRLVIPVLAEHKRKLKGFILDESATGQTVFIEPAEALEANNELRDLLFEERREVVKVLKDLTALIRINLPSLRPAYDFLAIVEFNYAKAKFARDIDALFPKINPEPMVDWQDARHPLLYLSLKGKRKVVPLTIDLNSKDRYLLISGPNAGGKSVCIKTVGLLQYMVQCGLLVPMDEKSTVGIFDSVFIDIGDQQSLENDLSTYSSHLKNMDYFVRHAGEKSLIILDELGSGTDPNFGGGIAEAVLDTLIDKKSWGVATTHYYNLKLFSEKKEGIRNASMLFDTNKLEPLFQLEIGKPGSSFALEIARKTGLPSTTLHKAEDIIGKELTGLETLMKKVSEEKQELVERQAALIKKEKELKEALAKYQSLYGELENKKKDIIEKARVEASSLLKETNREIEKTIRHIKENKAHKNETRKVRDNLKNLEEKVQPVKVPVNAVAEMLEVGDKVRIRGQEVTGTILSIKDSQAVVQFGDLRSTLKVNQLVRSDLVLGEGTKTRLRNLGIDVFRKQSTFDSTLDVRGKRVEEVIPLIDQFLDDALLLGQAELKILHGKGEGVLRKVVRERLKLNKGVASYADEHVDRGGDGITIVVLK